MFLVALSPEGLMVRCEGRDCIQDGDDFAIIKGETFAPSGMTMLHDALWAGKLERLSSVIGEFCFVHYSQLTGDLCFGTDRLGRETLFYHTDGKRMAVSDDFWQLAEYINAGPSDVDPQSVKESAALNYPLFYGTFIKNVYFVPPATYVVYSSCTRQVKFSQYWDLRYSPDPSIALSDAVKQMDDALQETFEQIRALNPRSTYGVGLSGGLDSRLVPYYALKNDMPIKSFIIGQSHPHMICLSRDHSSAREIARFYGLEHSEVEWNGDGFEQKMLRDIRNYPMGTSQFFISVVNGIPTFDVLLTGASGMIVGSEIPKTITSMGRSELLNAIVSHCSLIGKSAPFASKAVRGIREIIGLSGAVQTSSVDLLKTFYSVAEYETIMDKFSSFVSSELDKGKSNLEVYQAYFVFFLGSRNKYGAFESLQGLRKSYSIYTSSVLDSTLKWPAEYLLDRAALKEVIRRIIPDLARVKAQDHRPPIDNGGRSGLGTRVISMAEYLIRGSGVGRHEIWARRRDYREFALGILHNPNSLFCSIFDVDKLKYFLKSSPRFFEKLVKTRKILDLIESGEYKQLCSLQPKAQQPLTIWSW